LNVIIHHRHRQIANRSIMEIWHFPIRLFIWEMDQKLEHISIDSIVSVWRGKQGERHPAGRTFRHFINREDAGDDPLMTTLHPSPSSQGHACGLPTIPPELAGWP